MNKRNNPLGSISLEAMKARLKPKADYGTCNSCEQPLLQPFGFLGTELCGPCCTGEAATILTLTYLCMTCKNEVESDDERCPFCQTHLEEKNLWRWADWLARGKK